MKIRKLLLSFLAGIALIFELLPNGVVLRFMNPEGEPWVRTYSYFSLVPYGYANFGPLIAAVLTCVLIILIAISSVSYTHLFYGNRSVQVDVLHRVCPNLLYRINKKTKAARSFEHAAFNIHMA